MEGFQRDQLNAIGGHYGLHQGVTLASDFRASWADWRAVEKHEYIHSELVDMSLYGWFQRFLHTLGRLESTPPNHAELYRRVLRQTLSHSFLVHEGVATFREVLWYRAYTDLAEKALADLPDDYREAYDRVAAVMPRDISDDPRMQAAVHSVCDILGVFLLDAPLLDHYRDWDELDREELPYIHRDGPDARLHELENRQREVTPILRRALQTAAEVIERDLVTPDAPLSRHYWDFFNETLRELGHAVPELPIVDPADKRRAMHRLVKSWKRDERLPYLATIELAHAEDDESPPPDVGQERLVHGVTFRPLNAAATLEAYEERGLNTPLEYVGVLDSIAQQGNLAFSICVCNPTAEAIPLVRNEKMEPNSISGLLFEIDGAALERGTVQVAGSVSAVFGFPLSVLQSVERDVEGRIRHVRYLNFVHYRLLSEHRSRLVGPEIVRATRFEDFLAVEELAACDYLGLWRRNGIETIGYCSGDRFFVYPATLWQRREIEKNRSPLPVEHSGAPTFPLGAGGSLTADQMAALAYFGMSPG